MPPQLPGSTQSSLQPGTSGGTSSGTRRLSFFCASNVRDRRLATELVALAFLILKKGLRHKKRTWRLGPVTHGCKQRVMTIKGTGLDRLFFPIICSNPLNLIVHEWVQVKPFV